MENTKIVGQKLNILYHGWIHSTCIINLFRDIKCFLNTSDSNIKTISLFIDENQVLRQYISGYDYQKTLIFDIGQVYSTDIQYCICNNLHERNCDYSMALFILSKKLNNTHVRRVMLSFDDSFLKENAFSPLINILKKHMIWSNEKFLINSIKENQKLIDQYNLLIHN